MAGSSTELHEDPEILGPDTIDRHRAIVSLMEELEAVDWYDQRAKATRNAELREILEHNRDEEKEHACMVLEWLRRQDPRLSEELKTYLWSEGPITSVEETAMGGDGEAPPAGESASAAADGSLGIGSLKPAGVS